MKKTGIAFMMMLLVVASSFTLKTNSVHETKFDADIVELAASQDFLTTLVAAVKAGDLVETLQGDGPFTVFAPTNEAFAKLPEGTVENLLKPENKAQLVKILTYHVVPGKVMSADLKNGQMAKTAEGSSIKVTLMDGKAMVNNATVTTADIEADNGVVHIIDTVIMPPM
ncbi:fasciclin domain-containing protein [Algoriphagus halophytocola]|uniref:Fasciclin domain-containing protein n=1 Tax=Algoriphagus halophytocola TaxID=2991499 RepID=A0ABY6MFL6_9BACT|nr:MULTISPECIES: fasciclin domain-containing protein [unclassified Algoriphagus]UZD21749.1 fasciclin domain-containing protein [Algoriphagus sp. TR-M5]WBL42961.1 fasciclin domain-containing protein [Algoriphagus sp. TR-M9]